MSETLTQAEIDALRNAVRTGNVEKLEEKPSEKPSVDLKVVSYDFRKPKLLSAERMLTLQFMHQSLAKRLQGLLFTMFKVSGKPALEALEQVTYGEYVLSVASPSCLLGATISPEIGSMAVELSPPLGQMVLDLLLGSSEISHDEEDIRELSEFEFEILRTFNDRLMEEMVGTWSSLCDLEFQITSHGVSTDQVQVATPDTPCLIAIILLGIEEKESRIQICYPFSVLQEIFKLSDSLGEDQAGKRAEHRKTTLHALYPAPLSLEVELGRTRITARDLSTLSVGDVIKLDQSVGNAFPVTSDAHPIGKAFIGAHRGRLAACIERMQPVKKAAPPPAPAPAKK